MPGQRFFAALVVTACLAVAACSDDPGSQAGSTSSTAATSTTTATVPERRIPDGPVPGVEGPITGGAYGVPYNPMPPALRDEGYVEDEYFVSGEATSFEPVGALGADGAWTVEPSATAPYTTRILVRRPADPADFSGTVVVEWLNVSSGRDSDADFGFLYPRLVAEGDAYVAVSAQEAGVEGGGFIEVPGVPEEVLLPLKEWDAERYGDLSHPGDDYSYDIFSQVGRLARSADGPLSDLDVATVIGVGQSQSAIRLGSYVNAVQPEHLVYDGFLVHSRTATSAPISAASADAMPQTVALRTDLAQPVLQFQTETDLITLGFAASRQPDSDRVVTWEVAGTAHADASTLVYGGLSARVWLDTPEPDWEGMCGGPLNRGQQSEVAQAGYDALVKWAQGGPPPPSGDQLVLEGTAFATDELGIAEGGVRTPAVDAPSEVVSGLAREGSSVFCLLFGRTDPLPDGSLDTLYPTHDDYVAAVTESADAAVDAGFLLPVGREAIVEAAEAADVP